MKALRSCLALIVILAIILGGGYLYVTNYYNNQINDKSGTGESITIEIPEGSTSADIAMILKNNGLIEHELVFNYYIRDTGSGANLKAGAYEFLDTDSIIEMVDIMTQGQLAQGIRVTIPEGLRYDEITSIIADEFQTAGIADITITNLENIITSPNNYEFSSEIADFLTANKPQDKNLEGFLYPDTYEFQKQATPLEIISILLDNFRVKTSELQRVNTDYTFYEYVIMASIVEREANPGEFSEVAGIFWNRLNGNDKLGSDSSVLYPLKRWQPEPNYQELNTDNAYNTRLNFGIPPTPIANPGIAALEATFSTESSEYWFFIHDTTGQIHYAKTQVEQDENINQYLR